MQLFLCVVTPSSVLLYGALRLLFPPKAPTARSGYRSTLAMMNAATWAEAQRMSGKAMLMAGLTGLAASLLLYSLVDGRGAYLGSMLAGSLSAALTVPYTELRLRAAFDEKGNRKP